MELVGSDRGLLDAHFLDVPLAMSLRFRLSGELLRQAKDAQKRGAVLTASGISFYESGSIPDLFTLAPFSDEDTSRAAAKAITPHLARLEAWVLSELRHATRHPLCGATAEQLEELTGLSGNTVRPRLVTLRARGLVRDSGERRKTRSGRMACVWIAT